MDPYFRQHQNQKRRQHLRIKLYTAIGGAALLLIFLAYTLLYSPVFKIRSFTISGKENHSDQEVLKVIESLVFNTWFRNLLGMHNLIAWGTLHPDISKTAFIEATVERNWLKQEIQIRVKERERLAIWCSANNTCNWIDDNGMAFEEAPQTEGSLILTVQDSGTNHIIAGSRVLEDRFISNLVAMLKEIKTLRLSIKNISYDSRLQEIHAETYGGTKLLFSVRFDSSSNIASFRVLQGKTDINKLAYVDMRVENRIYYKSR